LDLDRRRRGDRRQPARSPAGSAGVPERRGARVGRFTRAGVAAALSILSRPTGPALSSEDSAQVEVEAGNFRVPHYGRRALDQIIEEAAAAHGVSAHLVRAVVEAESGFNPWAVSPAGAQGLMQLMPATAALMGVNDRMDPRQNVFGGSQVPEPAARPLRRQRGPGSRRVQRRPHEGRPKSQHPPVPRDARLRDQDPGPAGRDHGRAFSTTETTRGPKRPHRHSASAARALEPSR
jgi:hypothetical protein